ncbi:hypothetical protein ACTVZO_02200 [Streptomyces sp. IBSNAI002]|uniref:hypothetical protein n=1 Tax=Streptomyces sp. IBSNAI002 TaxID=3457500 RepID=UPI003FD0EEC4
MSTAVGAGAEPLLEGLLADLQLELAGLPGSGRSPAAGRAGALAADAARLGLGAYLGELLGTGPPVPGTRTLLDLEADEEGRRRSHTRWCAEARDLTVQVWDWLADRRAEAAPGRPWWSTRMAFPLPAGSLHALAAATAAPAPLAPLAPLAREWARTAGVADGTAEHNWRWLMLGKGLLPPGTPLPGLNELITGLVERLRDRSLLPAEHRVKVLRRPNSPSMVQAVRLPGLSLLSIPTAVTPVTVQYLQHELGHLVEHALRPPGAPLAERWSFDPVRSEGWALLLEHLVRSPAVLRELGMEPSTAGTVARFLAQEERFSRGLMAVDAALDTALDGVTTPAAALARAAELAAPTGLHWAPELLLLRQVRIVQWRAYLAGYAWRDAALATLTSRFGPGWPASADAWALLRAALAATGSAGDFLHTLRTSRRAAAAPRRQFSTSRTTSR